MPDRSVRDRHNFQGIEIGTARRQQCRHAAIQRHEPPAVADRKPKQIGIRDVPMPDQEAGRDAFLQHGDVVGPECVMVLR